MPYLDQLPLFQQFDFTYPASNCAFNYSGANCNFAMLANGGLPSAAHINAQVAGTKLAVFECASEPGHPLGNPTTTLYAADNAYAEFTGLRTNYLFSSGHFEDYSAPFAAGVAGTGMFGNNGAARFAHVIDGLSNTIMVGESRQQQCNNVYGPRWGSGTHTAVHGHVADAYHRINYPCGTDPNCNCGATAAVPLPYPRNMLQYAWGFGSWHAGGAHFLMGDGTVRFFADEMPLGTIQALATIAGGESVDF